MPVSDVVRRSVRGLAPLFATVALGLLVDPADAHAQVILNGSQLQVAVAPGGRLLSGGTSLRYAGFDFFVPGTPVYNFVVAYGASNLVNPFGTVVDQSSGTQNVALAAVNLATGVRLERRVSFDDADAFVRIVDTVTNTSGSPTPRIIVMDSGDPDPGNTFVTSNDVVSVVQAADLVQASAAGLFVAFATPDPARWHSANGFNNTNALGLYGTVSDPNGANGDIGINKLVDFGVVPAGGSRSSVSYILFGRSAAAVQDPYRARLASDLAASGTVSVDPVPQGATFTYTATATNQSASPADGGTLTVRLDPGVTFVGATGGAGATGLSCTFTASTRTVSCPVPPLAIGGSASFIVTVTAVASGDTVTRVETKPYGTDPDTSDDVATIRAVVLGPNAQDDAYTTAEDTTLDLAAPGVLANDTDTTGSGPFTVTLVTAPGSGTLTLRTDGGFRYVPAANFSGSVAFTYRATNALGQFSLADATINVTAVNDPPVASPRSLTVVEDTAAAATVSGSDPEGTTLTYTIVTAPAKGALSGTGPTYTYTPTLNANGADTFRFRVTDADGLSAEADVTVTITPVNDAPVASNQSVFTITNTAVAISAVATDVDGDALTWSIVTGPTRGALTGTLPNVTYTPQTGYVGADFFSFRVSDGTATSNTASIIVNVGRSNAVPVANPLSVSTPEDTPRALTLTGTDDDGDALLFSVLTSPANGSLLGAPPDLTYTPAPGFSGTDTFTFSVSDRLSFSNVATVRITVTPVNDAPSANALLVDATEDTALAITLAGNDPEADPLTFRVTVPPSRGTLTGTGVTRTYTPATDYVGTDSFAYVANDGALDSSPAIVTIRVAGVDDPPRATPLEFTTQEDVAIALALAGSDPEGDPLTFQVATQPGNGTLSGTPPSLTYRPRVDFSGEDSFTFTVRSGTTTSQPATVSITVTPANDAPVAVPGSATTDEDVPVAVTLSATDVDGDTPTFELVEAPAHGTLSGTAPLLTYRPAANYNGPDRLIFRARDASLASAPAVFDLVVRAVNDAPVATPLTVTLVEDGSASITLAGTDPDGDRLAFSITTPPARGTLTGTPPNLSYRPDPNAHGTDSFTFTVRDAGLTSAPATVSLEITAVNDAPVARDADYATDEETPVPFVLGGSDVDGDTLTFEVISVPSRGALSGAAPNLTYTPFPDATGTDQLVFRVSDGRTSSPPATVRLSIAPQNDVPVALAQSLRVDEDDVLALVLRATDGDGDALTYLVETPPAHGTLQGTAPVLLYRPAPDFNGRDSLRFVARDGVSRSTAAEVVIDVRPVNDAPVLQPSSAATDEEVPVAISITATDVDGDTLTFTVTRPPARGRLQGTWPALTYAPDADAFGDDRLEFTLSDGTVSVAGSTTIVVRPVNDGPVLVAPTPSGPLTAHEGELLEFRVAARDVDGPPTQFRVDGGPTSLRADPVSGAVRWNPRWDEAGTYALTLTASDGTASATRIVALTVTFADLDADRLPDTWERTVNLDPARADTDNDGISDFVEVDRIEAIADTDGDGAPDARDGDSDGDGHPDSEEAGSDDPAAPADTDGDGTADFRDDDSDGDGVPDDGDLCRVAVDPGQEDLDGDGTGDACDDDLDGDGLANVDEVRAGFDPRLKDGDGDMIPDRVEWGDGASPRDTDGTLPPDGADTDSDDDGVPDDDEAGDADPATAPVDTNGDGDPDYRDADSDGDSVTDGRDTCRLVSDPAQVDTDGDGDGDACDGDLDGDGVPDEDDNCRFIRNTDQADRDADGAGNACEDDDDGDGVPDGTDLCPLEPDPDQADTDRDGQGDACDEDDDADSVNDGDDNCPLVPNTDQDDFEGDGDGDLCDPDDDDDGTTDDVDNCANLSNPGQEDDDLDGIGTACDPTPYLPLLVGGCDGPGGSTLLAALAAWLLRRRRSKEVRNA